MWKSLHQPLHQAAGRPPDEQMRLLEVSEIKK